MAESNGPEDVEMNDQDDDEEDDQDKDLYLTAAEKQKLADIIYTYMAKTARHGVASHEVLVRNIRNTILTNFKEGGMNWQPFKDEHNNAEIAESLRGIIDQVVYSSDRFDRLLPVSMETDEKTQIHEQLLEAFSRKKNIKKEDLK